MTPYDKIPGIRSSELKHAANGIRAYLRAKLDPPNSYALRLGTALHLALEGCEDWARRIHPGPTATHTAKAWVTEEAMLDLGHVMIKQDDVRLVHEMREAILAHPEARRLYHLAPEREVVRQWARDGVPCKAKLDAVGGPLIVDWKTTNADSARALEWAIRDFGYALQMAWYQEGQAAHTGERADDIRPVLVFVQTERYPEVFVRPVMPDEIEDARLEIDAALARIAAYHADPERIGFLYDGPVGPGEIDAMFSNH